MLTVIKIKLLYGYTGRGSITGDYGKLHNEELNNWYSSPNIISMII
jgi:hypothetical protein